MDANDALDRDLTREVEKGANRLAANRKYETEKIFEKQLANHSNTALRIWEIGISP